MSEWQWPAEMEGMIAAPEHHKLLLENDEVVVIDVFIPKGEKTKVHTHRWPGVYHTLAASDFIRRDADDNVLFDSRTAAPGPPTAYLGSLGPHTVENVGNADMHVVSVEVKGRE